MWCYFKITAHCIFLSTASREKCDDKHKLLYGKNGSCGLETDATVNKEGKLFFSCLCISQLLSQLETWFLFSNRVNTFLLISLIEVADNQKKPLSPTDTEPIKLPRGYRSKDGSRVFGNKKKKISSATNQIAENSSEFEEGFSTNNDTHMKEQPSLTCPATSIPPNLACSKHLDDSLSQQASLVLTSSQQTANYQNKLNPLNDQRLHSSSATDKNSFATVNKDSPLSGSGSTITVVSAPLSDCLTALSSASGGKEKRDSSVYRLSHQLSSESESSSDNSEESESSEDSEDDGCVIDKVIQQMESKNKKTEKVDAFIKEKMKLVEQNGNLTGKFVIFGKLYSKHIFLTFLDIIVIFFRVCVIQTLPLDAQNKHTHTKSSKNSGITSNLDH